MYRDEEGKSFVFDIVKKVELELAQDFSRNKDYKGLQGIIPFVNLAQELCFGKNSSYIVEQKIASVQSVSCSGATSMAFQWIKKHNTQNEILISKENWDGFINQIPFEGLKIIEYPYYDRLNNKLNIEDMLSSLKIAKQGSVILLQVCAHNPTGIDPTKEQWVQIAQVCKQNKLLPLFDFAYQGFADSLSEDRYPIQLFLEMGFQIIVAQSFSKNMGLYADRCGCLHFVCKTKDYATKILQNLKYIIRGLYLSPPQHGAEVALKILENDENFRQWENELTYTVVKRIKDTKQIFIKALKDANIPGDWNYLNQQKGMFIYFTIQEQIVDQMQKQYSIYFLRKGRINICGLNQKNIQYFISSLKQCLEQAQNKQTI